MTQLLYFQEFKVAKKPRKFLYKGIKKIKKTQLLMFNCNIELVFCNCIEWIRNITNTEIFTIFNSLKKFCPQDFTFFL